MGGAGGSTTTKTRGAKIRQYPPQYPKTPTRPSEEAEEMENTGEPDTRAGLSFDRPPNFDPEAPRRNRPLNLDG